MRHLSPNSDFSTIGTTAERLAVLQITNFG
jgi:hypothetical protein